MTQKPTLAVVDAAPAAHAAAPLSAAKEAVARAIAWRRDANAAVEEAGRAHQNAERLLAAPDRIKARIAEIEASNAGIVERWASAGGTGQPELSGAEEIEALRRELAQAERLAAAARIALPNLLARVNSGQTSVTAALAAVREAIVQVVFEEAQVLVEQIRDLEKKSALVRASYQGAINTLDRLGRAHRFGGTEAQRLRVATPARMGAGLGAGAAAALDFS